MFLYEVTDALDRAKIPFALVGGFALALHGIVRATLDVDLVLGFNLDNFESAERALKKIGLTPRLPVRAAEVFHFRAAYVRDRNLIAWSFVDYANPSRIVDVVLTHDRLGMDVEKISVGGRRIPVASLTELAAMKRQAGRPKDRMDLDLIEEKLRAKNG